jgi:hypothetical protein
VLHNPSGQNRRGVVEALFAKGFKPASIGDLDWSRLHTLEVTPEPNLSDEQQSQVFSGAGVTQPTGSPRYGYTPGYDSSDAKNYFPLTESAAHRIAIHAARPSQ